MLNTGVTKVLKDSLVMHQLFCYHLQYINLALTGQILHICMHYWWHIYNHFWTVAIILPTVLSIISLNGYCCTLHSGNTGLPGGLTTRVLGFCNVTFEHTYQKVRGQSASLYRTGANVFLCHSYLVWLLLKDFILACACFHLKPWYEGYVYNKRTTVELTAESIFSDSYTMVF